MTIQVFFKGLFMLLITLAVTAFSQVPVNYAQLAITALFAVLTYTGLNLTKILHTNSEPGKFNFIDFIAALLVALASAGSEALSSIVVGNVIVWSVLGKIFLGTAFTFIGNTFFSSPQTQSKKLFAK